MKGFTLIELLVVVLIIGILSAVALPQYQRAVRRSQFVEILNISRVVKQEQQLFKLANGEFAQDFAELDFQPPAGWEIRADKKVLFYRRKNLSLDIAAGGLSTVYWGWNGEANNLAFQQYWDTDRRNCIAYAIGGEEARGFCASLGGVTKSSSYPYVYVL